MGGLNKVSHFVDTTIIKWSLPVHTTGTLVFVSVFVSAQVGIVTLQTAREVAAEDGVAETSLDPQDERVGAVVVTGAQLT